MFKKLLLDLFFEEVPSEAPKATPSPAPAANQPATVRGWLRGLVYEEVLDEDDLFPEGCEATFDDVDWGCNATLADLDSSAEGFIGFDGEFDSHGCGGFCMD